MKTRLHPTVIIENIFRSIWAIIALTAYIISNGLQSSDGDDINKAINFLTGHSNNIVVMIIVIFSALILIFTLFFYIRWRNTYLIIDKDELTVKTGRLFKNVSKINVLDIATINIKRNILEQVFGTASLKIELNNNIDTSIKTKLVFKNDIAKCIKNRILNGEEEQEIDSLINYTSKDILRHMWLSVDLRSFIILLVMYLIILVTDNGEIFKNSLIVIVVGIIVFLYPLFVSVIKNFFSYYNFKATREDNTIKLSYGLLTTYHYSLPIEKINALIIKQSLQARLSNYYCLEVVNAGVGNDKNENEKTIISLYIPAKMISEVLHNIVPEFENEISLKKESKCAFYHHIIKKFPLFLISLALVPFIKYYFILIWIFLLICSYGEYRTNKIGFNNDKIIIQKGIINKKITITLFNNIEYINLKTYAFSKILKTYQLNFSIVAPGNNNTLYTGLFTKQLLEKAINTYLGEKDEH